MAYNFSISPDFGPVQLAGWYLFNTWLQRTLGVGIHIELYPDFHSQRSAIAEDKIDLIYANPYDASMLVREKGFVPLVRPTGKRDEALIAVAADGNIVAVEELRPGITVAITDDPDVYMMGMMMLEPANLSTGNLILKKCDSYLLIAKQIFAKSCDAGIFLAEAYNDFSSIVKGKLRVLVHSDIQVVHHALLAGPALAENAQQLQRSLVVSHYELTR